MWATEFLPFADMPEHVAVIGTLAHWFDPSFRLREHYVVALADTQYVAYHLAGALIAVVVRSAETANRVLLTVVALSFPFAARSLLRARRGDERLAVLAAPLFWTRALLIGFLPYVASVPVLLWALAAAVRAIEAPSRRHGVTAGALAVGLYYVHVDAFVLYGLVTFALAIALPDDRAPDLRELSSRVRTLPRRLVWLAPAAACAVFYALSADVTMYGGSLSHEIWYVPVGWTVHDFPIWAHDVWTSHVDDWLAVVFWGVIVWLAVQRASAASGWYRAAVAWIPFACALVLFLALPFQIGAGSMLNVRLATFLVLFVLLVIAPSASPSRELAVRAAAVLTVLVAANATFEVRRVEREELGRFDRILDAVPRGARLVTLVFHASSQRTHWPAWIAAGSYHRARAGGVAEYSFSRLRHWPVHFRPDRGPPLKDNPFWEFTPCVYRNAIDGPYYDYVLVRGELDPFRDAPPGPRWHLVVTEKDWHLYARSEGEWPPWDATTGATLEDPGPCGDRVKEEERADDGDAER